MENTETIAVLQGIEPKTSKNGREYWSINTTAGSFTCFEKDIIENLGSFLNKNIKFEVAENDKGFKNFRKFLGAVEGEAGRVIPTSMGKSPSTSSAVVEKSDQFKAARETKDQSIYTSYAKDIFKILFVTEKAEHPEAKLDTIVLMQQACKIIKTAREEFK